MIMVKDFHNWTPLSTTQQLIKSFNDNPDADGWLTANKSSDLENSKNENQKSMHWDSSASNSDWMKVEKGGNNHSNQVISGTYIHPRLLPALGMWISPKFYFLAAEIIENFAIRSFKRANHELETKLKRVELQCNQLNEELDKEKHEINVTEDMLKGAMNQVVALSRELEDDRDLLAHSELDTSYYKKLVMNSKYKNWKRKFVN